MNTNDTTRRRLFDAIKPKRLLDNATKLVGIPSRTGEAKACLDGLAEILTAEGFAVERPIGDYPQAPAVAVRYRAGQPGKTDRKSTRRTPVTVRNLACRLLP